ncbi:helix-turn-helix domain-containing protein [Methylobacterium sp. J-088]|uniref:helix-turn-helix domain-containing protein n=1 Tax=Methylobacterium sp. J-088 TaxID=2836664 RepID=UPI001FBBB097|nr:helix-turn-helix domain-containing protein [Methylobacterium sp. J-088]MCJ2064407.1 helix-turn-helix domain-containing protein [Methylobacterium sp. J-088]
MSKKEAAPPGAPGAMTVDEFADYLRISRTGVYRLFERGDLKPLKIGRRTLVRRADADAFLASCVRAA